MIDFESSEHYWYNFSTWWWLDIIITIEVQERVISEWVKTGDCLPNGTIEGTCGTRPGIQKETRTCTNGNIIFCDEVEIVQEVECNITIDCPSTMKTGIDISTQINEMNWEIFKLVISSK